jgi:hypothetical protein
MRGYVLVALCVLSSAVRAEDAPVDCDRLKTSAMPFQVSFDFETRMDNMATAKTYQIYQQYREPSERHALVGGEWHIVGQLPLSYTKTEAIGRFVLSSTRIPTGVVSQYYYKGIDPLVTPADAKVSYSVTSISAGAKSFTDREDETTGKNTVLLGGCSFAVYEIRSKIKVMKEDGTGLATMLVEASYSPELKMLLKSKSDFLAAGKHTIRELTPRSLALSFEPFK